MSSTRASYLRERARAAAVAVPLSSSSSSSTATQPVWSPPLASTSGPLPFPITGVLLPAVLTPPPLPMISADAFERELDHFFARQTGPAVHSAGKVAPHAHARVQGSGVGPAKGLAAVGAAAGAAPIFDWEAEVREAVGRRPPARSEKKVVAAGAGAKRGRG